MENSKRDDPVVEEIREIRERISQITEGFSDEQLLEWYHKEAQKFLGKIEASPSSNE